MAMNYRQVTPIVGTATNDAAAAGDVGEEIRDQLLAASANSLATTVAEDVITITLTPGDWDVSSIVGFITGASTSVTNLQSGISLTSATSDSEERASAYRQAAAVPGAGVLAFSIQPSRISVAINTVVYPWAAGTFTVSTLAVFGTLRARRMR